MDAPPGRCAVAQGLTACRQARVRPEPRVWARGPSAQRPPARCLLGRRWRGVGPGRRKESPRDLRGLLRDHWSLGFGDNGGKLLSAEKRGEQTARLAAPEHRPPCFFSPRETRSGQAASLSLEGRQRDAPGGGARASEGAPVAQTRPRVPRPQPLLKKTGLWKQAGWALRHDAFVACGRWRNGH